MREAHAVIQSQATGNLPGICRIEFRRDVAERGNDVEILFRILGSLAGEHVRIRVAGGTPTPASEDHRPVNGSVARLFVPGALPVEAKLGRVCLPHLHQIVRDGRQGLLRIDGAIELKPRVQHIGNAAAPPGHLREEEVLRIWVAEEQVVVETERRALHLGRVLETVREVQVRVAENLFVGETRAENLGQVRSHDVRRRGLSNGRGIGRRRSGPTVAAGAPEHIQAVQRAIVLMVIGDEQLRGLCEVVVHLSSELQHV